jgi:hypothetical protein
MLLQSTILRRMFEYVHAFSLIEYGQVWLLIMSSSTMPLPGPELDLNFGSLLESDHR